MNGVRAQLNLLVAATTSLVLIAFAAPLGLLLRRTAEERAVAAATQRAQETASLVSLGQEPTILRGEGPAVTVFYPDGRVLGAPAPRTDSVELAARGEAFTAQYAGGIEVLIPVQGLPDGTAVVRAYASQSLLHQGVAQTWVVLGLLGLVLLGLGVLLADRLGRRLVGSVTALAATADRLSSGDLTARAPLSTTPELARVRTALNRLAGRIQELLAAEREEVADLTHRLRTPVTALRLNVESVHDPQDRARLSADLDVLSRLVDEVIRTARRTVREGVRPECDLVAVTAERVRFWSVLAEDANRPLNCRLPTRPVLVRCAPDDLAAALDALLENVFSHTPDGTPLRVEVTESSGGGGVVTIEDGGPGFPAALRGRGESSAGSTGLGLDIARRTASAAGGFLHLGTGQLGGALVELYLGPPS